MLCMSYNSSKHHLVSTPAGSNNDVVRHARITMAMTEQTGAALRLVDVRTVSFSLDAAATDAQGQVHT